MKRVLVLSVLVMALVVAANNAFALVEKQPIIAGKMVPGASEIQQVKDNL